MMNFGYLLCFRLFGPRAYGFHLVNLLLHGFVVVLQVQMRRAVALAPLDVKARAVWGNSTSVSSGSRRAVPPVSRNTTRQQGISRSRNGPLAPRRREGSGALLHRSGLPGSSMAQPHIMLGLLYLDLG